MGQVGGNTGRINDIVESELVDKRASLEEEGERLCGLVLLSGAKELMELGESEAHLANAARSASNNYAEQEMSAVESRRGVPIGR